MAGSDVVTGFGESQTGNFDVGGVAQQGRVYQITDTAFFTTTDEHGRKWGMMGMHIASKNLRTWQWTSLVWGAFGPGHGDWEVDQPASFTQQWPQLQGYGLVTASDFTEGDSKPYAGFLGTSSFNSLGVTLRDISNAMGGYQWCANPYLEVGMSRTNCIGCHQGAPKEFKPGRLKQVYATNVGDFSFSIARNRDMFIRVLAEQARFRQQRFIRPSGVKAVKP